MASVNAHLELAEQRRLFWARFCPKEKVNAMAPRILNRSQRVDIGTFVQLRRKDDNDEYQVVRIFDVDRDTDPIAWKCVVYERFVGSCYQGSESEIVVGLGANVPELIMTDKVVRVAAQEMHCIAFVFHFMELNKQTACLHGIDNGYFVRFRVPRKKKQEKQEIPLSEWFAFPCDSPSFDLSQSFVKTVFEGLDYIKHFLSRAANKCGDTQGTFPRSRFSNLFFSSGVWRYIVSRTSQLGELGEDISFEQKVKKRKVCRIVSNVSISSVSFCKLEDVETIRYQSVEGVNVIEKILGIGSVWGFRHRRPKYGNRLVAVRNDTMNAVFGDDCYVELSYNKTANRLAIIVQFDSFLFDFDDNGKLKNCPCPNFDRYCRNFGLDDASNIKNAVVIGAFFRLEGQTYEIVNVKNGDVGPPMFSDAVVYARIREGADEGTLHSFKDEWMNIGNRVQAYYA